jgi:hypothetical protein
MKRLAATAAEHFAADRDAAPGEDEIRVDIAHADPGAPSCEPLARHEI